MLIIILSGRYNLTPGHYFVPHNIGYKIAVVFIIAVSSLRFNIGTDWNAYLDYFYPTVNTKAIERLEPTNKAIIYITDYLGQPIVFFAIYAVIIYSLICRTFEKYSVSKYESLIIYIAVFYVFSLNGIRQAAAIAVAFWGYKYIEERKPVRYFLTCAVAVCFHYSALIVFIFYPIYHLKIYWSFIASILFIIGMKVVLPVVVSNLFQAFVMYLDPNFLTDNGRGLTKIFYLLVYIYCLILHPKDSVGYLNICTLGVTLPFVIGSHTGERMAQYFLIYYCLLIPKCNKRFDINYRALFLMLFYIYFFLYLFACNGSNEYIPFRWYFLENLDQGLK